MSEPACGPSPSPSASADAASPTVAVPSPAPASAPPGVADPASGIHVEDDRTSTTPEGIRRAFIDHLRYTIGKDDRHATPHDRFLALALTARDRLSARWIRTQEAYRADDAKRVYYLSAEFLLGRALRNNLFNLGILDQTEAIVRQLGLSLGDVLEQERDAGLGNGGLGRLAACYLDSMATLAIPGYGYGIRYEFGIFDQVIRNGAQIERPEEWLRMGNPWEIPRPEYTQHVHFYGGTEFYTDSDGQQRVRWVNTSSVLGVPYDTPIAGYGSENVNTLRLWSARASEEFDLNVFNAGDYERAVFDKNASESISKVLYPNDLLIVGKELRLKQQYFFVACSIADLLRRHLSDAHYQQDPVAMLARLRALPDKVAIQLNDTHPAITIPELMRQLVDIYGLPWDEAWEITTGCIAYTNHTLLPEALEQWSVQLLGKLLPRHLQIIYEINHRFLRQVWTASPDDPARMERMSLIAEQPQKAVRMAYLATVGSHSVNGVAALHSQLLQKSLLPEFAALYPERFINITNGVTPRRWLMQCNPALTRAITRRIGAAWQRDLDQLQRLAEFADDPTLHSEFFAVKLEHKRALSAYIRQHNHVSVDPTSLFDVQIKRLHEYKRQLLNVLHLIALYQHIKSGGRDVASLAQQALGRPGSGEGSSHPLGPAIRRVALFGAKAAPGYTRAKLIIRLINAVADVVNRDRHVADALKVIFLSNYRVSLAERIIPAADLSEQISTAGLEASGTGNMKLAMNGALTIGTLDGANIEIRERVGADNFFLFGLTAEEVVARRPHYNPWDVYRASPLLRGAIDLIRSGFFSYDDPQRFVPLLDSLLPPGAEHGDAGAQPARPHGDEYFVLADFDAYVACQARVATTWREPSRWARMAILNIANMGFFSSDRSIREYAERIWRVRPVHDVR
jgi:starch phosphorylase